MKRANAAEDDDGERKKLCSIPFSLFFFRVVWQEDEADG
jgi:hypothetical protein